MLTNYWKFPNRSVQTFGFVYHDTNGLWQDYCGKDNLRKSLKHGWEKIPNWECLFVHREKGFFLFVCIDDIKLAGKKQSLGPMWKVLHKEVDLGEPTSFLVYLGCTQRQCETSKDTVDNYRTMFESRISAGEVEKLPYPQNLRISSWSYDMIGHAKKCVERYCELANKSTQQFCKGSTPCIDDHHFKEEEMKSVGELSHVCSQIVLKCLYLARIGRPEIRWSENKLARAITKWTKACDKRLSRLISYIHHTCENKQYCHVGNTAKQCRLGLFQDSDFVGDLEDSKSTSGWTLCILGSHTFVSFSWMCKKQTVVSLSSTEFEIISGLKFDELSALELRDLIVPVLGSVSQFQIEQDDLIMTSTNIINLKEGSTCWRILILFLQMSNLRVKKLCCMCSKTMKQKESNNETCFQDSQSCTWLVVRSNQPGPKNPKQIHRRQEPICWHFNQRKFHAWWVESSVLFVQH